MWSLDKTTNKIVMTKGDTPSFKISCNKIGNDGSVEEYVPEAGDRFVFAAKRNKNDEEPLFFIDIPNDTLVLTIATSDTRNLDLGKYFYEVSLNKENGFVDTFIQGILMLTMEVYK